jgi:hypothetical protein
MLMGEGLEELTLCPQHGLRYDPKTHSGCVVCRRPAGVVVAEPPAGGALGTPAGGELLSRLRSQPLVLAAVGGAIVLVLLIVVVVAVRGSSTKDAEAATEVSADATPEQQLSAYLKATWAIEQDLPIDETRIAMEGAAQEAEQGRLDIDARKAKLEHLVSLLQEQQQRFAALAAPDMTTVHRQAVLNWFDRANRSCELWRDLLNHHKEVLRLIARKREVASREDALQLQSDVRTEQAGIAHTMDSSREITKQMEDLLAQKRAEEDRLIAEYKLRLKRP